MFKEEFPIKELKDCINITVKASPNASQNKIGQCDKISDNEIALKIYVTSKAEDGKANKAIINLLSKELKIAPSNISIIHGLTNRIKTIQIKNVTLPQVLMLFR